MPFGDARSLSDDDVYSLVAYILYLNDIMDEGDVLNKDNFTSIKMPNVDGFFDDDRMTSKIMLNKAAPCMKDCKETVEITKRALVIDVTPDQ